MYVRYKQVNKIILWIFVLQTDCKEKKKFQTMTKFGNKYNLKFSENVNHLICHQYLTGVFEMCV